LTFKCKQQNLCTNAANAHEFEDFLGVVVVQSEHQFGTETTIHACQLQNTDTDSDSD